MDEYMYVGETMNLLKRFFQHCGGSGSARSSEMNCPELITAYKLDDLIAFMEYSSRLDYYISEPKYLERNVFVNYALNDEREFNFSRSTNLTCENLITERLLLKEEKINFDSSFELDGTICGGKYTRLDCKYRNVHSEKMISEIPICKCGLPCGWKIASDKSSSFFRCSKKNIEWLDEDIEPCNFYQKYKKEQDVYSYFRDAGLRIEGEKVKIVLNVPYSEKDEAKKNGCLWDMEIKKWYCWSENSYCVKRWFIDTKR